MRARIRRFGWYAEQGHEFAFCRTVAGLDYTLAKRLWRMYIDYTNEGRFYD